jgi:hypothetical protein
LAFRSSRKEGKRRNEEETESAEVVPGKTMGGMDLPGSGDRENLFSRGIPALNIGSFFRLWVLCDLCG